MKHANQMHRPATESLRRETHIRRQILALRIGFAVSVVALTALFGWLEWMVNS